MRTQRNTLEINDVSWTELTPTFDILEWGLYSVSGTVYAQEYLEDGWNDTITITAAQVFSKDTCAQKLRFKSASGNLILNYTLSGFVTYRVKGEEVESSQPTASGDMEKSTYDTDNDGIVDIAKTVVGGVIDTSAIYNFLLLNLRTLDVLSIIFNGIVNPCKEATGIDLVNSVNASYASSLYSWPSYTYSVSYENIGGTGDRTAIITGSMSANFSYANTGVPSHLVNGTLNDTGFAVSDNNVVGSWLKFDFGTGKYISEVLIRQNSINVGAIWKWQGSNDDSNWTDVSTEQTWNQTSGISTFTLTSTLNYYRYYRLYHVSGSASSGPWIFEFEFKISNDAGLPHDFSLISQSYTSGIIPSKIYFLALIKALDTLNVNTNIIAMLGRSGITSLEQITLENLGLVDNDCSLLFGELDVSQQETGNSIIWNIKNESEEKARFEIRGVALIAYD